MVQQKLNNNLIKMKTIEEVLNFLDSIPNINRGGCGFAAYAVYLWLEKEDKIPDGFHILYMHNRMDSYEDNESFLKNKEGIATSCTHCCVNINGKYVDTEGKVDLTEYDKYLAIPPTSIKDFMKSSLQDELEWNPTFERVHYVPIIEEKLGIKFNIELRSIFDNTHIFTL